MAGSGRKAFSAGSILTAADVQNYLQDQAVMYFATTTARDAAITAPTRGMVAYIGSNDSSEGLYTYNGTSWRKGPGWNAPWGVVAQASKTSNVTGVTTGTQLHSVSFTAIANRYYKATAIVSQAGSTVAGDLVFFYIRSGTTKFAAALQRSDVAGEYYMLMTTGIRTESAGSVTYDMYGQRTGTGTASFQASADAPIWLIVEDVGPSGAPV